MKDSYSFDIDEAGLDASFETHRKAYERIFDRLGIPAFGAEASNGTMGGTDSIEFMCPSDAGEDRVVRCPSCGYAANLEKATSALSPVQDAGGPAAPARLATPGVRTIDDLANKHGIPADRQIKTLVQVINGQLTLVLLRGDHPLADQKLVDATGTGDIRPAQADQIRAALGAAPGSLGAVGVRELPAIADLALRGRRGRAVPPVWHRAGIHPGHRGRAHFQARPEIHDGARRFGPGPGRKRDHPDHGLLRNRRGAGDRRNRRGAPR